MIDAPQHATTIRATMIADTRLGVAVRETFGRAREAYATATLRETFAAGQAFAWNPSIAGAKSEDTILVTPAGPEVLAEADTFPTIETTAGGLTLRRPDILVF